jgi:hypothetical protein
VWTETSSRKACPPATGGQRLHLRSRPTYTLSTSLPAGGAVPRSSLAVALARTFTNRISEQGARLPSGVHLAGTNVSMSSWRGDAATHLPLRIGPGRRTETPDIGVRTVVNRRLAHGSPRIPWRCIGRNPALRYQLGYPRLSSSTTRLIARCSPLWTTGLLPLLSPGCWAYGPGEGGVRS